MGTRQSIDNFTMQITEDKIFLKWGLVAVSWYIFQNVLLQTLAHTKLLALSTNNVQVRNLQMDCMTIQLITNNFQ